MFFDFIRLRLAMLLSKVKRIVLFWKQLNNDILTAPSPTKRRPLPTVAKQFNLGGFASQDIWDSYTTRGIVKEEL